MANQQAITETWQPGIPDKISDCIIQKNFHYTSGEISVGGRIFRPTGLAEKDKDEWNSILAGGHAVAIFRFKPKAKSIDLGELA